MSIPPCFICKKLLFLKNDTLHLLLLRIFLKQQVIRAIRTSEHENPSGWLRDQTGSPINYQRKLYRCIIQFLQIFYFHTVFVRVSLHPASLRTSDHTVFIGNPFSDHFRISRYLQDLQSGTAMKCPFPDGFHGFRHTNIF